MVSGMLRGSDLLNLAGGLCSAAYIVCMHTALLLMQSIVSTPLTIAASQTYAGLS